MIEERIKRASKTRQVVNHSTPPEATEPRQQEEGTGTHPDLGQGSGLLVLPVLGLPGITSLRLVELY